ncbi:uncharacterized protein [Coffea arabica]|uniref:ATP-dependent DNA helicase n=1 Tax=Coffea arabica TaxID=13443 RepID=A0A6P6TF43_COFAR
MGRKRKSISEDERRIQVNQRRRERYAKKAAERQQKTQQSTEYENRFSHGSHAMSFSPIDDTLVDASIHNDVSLSALLKAGCTCFQMPVVSSSDQSAMHFSSTNDTVDEIFATSDCLLPQNILPWTTFQTDIFDDSSAVDLVRSAYIPYCIGPRRRRKNISLLQQIPVHPSVLPDVPDCIFCHAKRFYMEPPKFCCSAGEIHLAETQMPEKLVQLYKANTPEAREFQLCIRSYNNMFAFTSLGVHYDKNFSRRNNGIYTFRVQGQIYHFINPLVPSEGERATNLQLYFYDTQHEIANRMAISSKFRESIIQQLKDILHDNPYSTFIRSLVDLHDLEDHKIFLKSDPGLDQRVYNLPAVSQVAAMWNENDYNTGDGTRNIQIFTKTGSKRILKQYYGCYDTLQYPLIFAKGETGWHKDILRIPRSDVLNQLGSTCQNQNILSIQNCSHIDEVISAEEKVSKKKKIKRPTVSCREYYAYKFQVRDGDQSNLLHIGRLLQQYSVETYIKLETSRLEFHRHRQQHLRTEVYQGLMDSVTSGETSGSRIGKRIILPASFIGGPRDMRRRYMDAMSLVQRYGKPDIFLTMTCNPSWPEIKLHLSDEDEIQNRPDLISRVFRAKIEQLKDDLFKRNLFGEVAAYTYVIEFQKRGLPHAHFLIILKQGSKMFSPEAYDRIVSAELPDPKESPYLYSLVIKHMLHGPCGTLNPNNPCMRQNGKCRNNYPKEFSAYTKHARNSYPVYRRRNDGKNVIIREHLLDNRWVVPYNAYLLAKFDCHINVEICSAIEAVKYIYKYIYKGHDKVMYQITTHQTKNIIDEIHNFQSARWICAPEAMWRIFAFDLTNIHPSVMTMHLHLENYQPISFTQDQILQDVLRNERNLRTMLTEFLSMNRTNKRAQDLNCLYREFPRYFTWDEGDRIWIDRKRGEVIGRINTAHPVEGERYYLRMLLMHTDSGFDECLSEALVYKMPCSLRQLFAVLLVHCTPTNPRDAWLKFENHLSEDIRQNLALSQQQVQIQVLNLIDQHLQIMGKDITDYNLTDIPYQMLCADKSVKEIEVEYQIPISDEDLAAVSMLNSAQKSAFDKIMQKINENAPAAFFIDGPGGTGKSFLYKALLATVRSRGYIALATATSGAAASLLPGGRTAHSRFKIPLHQDIKQTCNISKQSSISKLLKLAKLIIWDEATMAKKYAIESFDAMLRDILDCDTIFGGKIIVFGGDFRQTLPVVRRGQKDDYISASLVNSYIWPHLQKMHLTENMRARLDPQFSDLLLRIGNGTEPTFGDSKIQLPLSILIPFMNDAVSLDQLISAVYPSLTDFIHNSSNVTNRAILTTTNDFVHDVNNLLIQRFPGQETRYMSFDQTLDPSKQADHGDFLNTIQPPGLPHHELILKPCCPIILLRNLNPAQGLCNGTRLICLNFARNLIHAQITSGNHSGKQVFIPRIPLHSSNDESYPIPFKRTQFPVSLCFAMTINKSQGQTLDFVGIYLKEPVFSHGQLYVAMSRARTAEKLKILLRPVVLEYMADSSTRNIVYEEILAAATAT